MIEELHRKAGIDRRLIGIGQRPRHLVEAEPGEQRSLVGNAVVNAHGKLIGAGVNLGRGGIGTIAVGSFGIVGQRIVIQHWNDGRIHRDSQRVARKSFGVDPLALGRRRHGKHLRCPQHLAKALVLAKIKSSVAAIVDFRKHHWAAVGETEFIAHEGRDAALVGDTLVVKIVAGIEGGIAGKFKKTAVHLVGA